MGLPHPSELFGEPAEPREYYDDTPVRETYGLHMGARNVIWADLKNVDFNKYHEEYEWSSLVRANQAWGRKQEGNIRNIRRGRGW